MEPRLQIILFVALFLLVILTIAWMIRTEKRLKRFFLGKKAKDLEDTILLLKEEISKLENARGKDEADISVLKEKMKKSIRGLETIRFNPFPDQGGNQSFAIGMLDEENNGVVISSLYSRDRMSVFAKPIKGGRSDYELTDEEKGAMERAKL